MKKILILLLMLSMIAAAFMGCTQKPAFGSSSKDTNRNGLRDDVELEMMEVYHNASNLLKDEKFSPRNFIVEYFGTYNGAVAVRITCKSIRYPDVVTEEMVGKTQFTYGNTNKIKIWKAGEFCGLSKAYEEGTLTDADIEAIHSAFVKK